MNISEGKLLNCDVRSTYHKDTWHLVTSQIYLLALEHFQNIIFKHFQGLWLFARTYEALTLKKFPGLSWTCGNCN